MRGELKGIGGWLGIFIFIVIVNTLYLLYDVLMGGFQYGGRSSMVTIVLIVQIGTIILFIRGIYQMIKYNKKGVELLKWVLWLPALNMALLALMIWNYGVQVPNEIIIKIFSAGIWALIWTSYLKKSVRVKNTYYKKKASKK